MWQWLTISYCVKTHAQSRKQVKSHRVSTFAICADSIRAARLMFGPFGTSPIQLSSYPVLQQPSIRLPACPPLPPRRCPGACSLIIMHPTPRPTPVRLFWRVLVENFAPHILITAPSNVAVDNIVSRILEEGFLDGEHRVA